MRKKILGVILAAAMAMSVLAGCGDAKTETGSTATESSQVESTEQPESSDATTESSEATTDNNEQTDDDGDITAIELTHLMGNGINLGNTMEAYGHTSLGVGADTSAYETLWGAPVTTPEMIQAMKDAGFDTLRIPVA